MSGQAELDRAPDTEGPPRGKLGRDLFLIAYAVFITTIAQDGVIGKLPVRLWLKNHLHVDAPTLAAFAFFAGFAWYLKPLFGIVLDSFPLFGTRRRWYMILSSLLAAGAWGLVSLGQAHYSTFLAADVVLGALMVVASTIMGALLVEAGQKYGATGRISSVRAVIMSSCSIITGPIGGWLAGRAFGMTAGIGAGLLISLATVAYFLLPEKPVAKRNTEVWVDAGRQLKVVLASHTLWVAAGLIILFYFSPGFATPLLYRQQNMLGFSDQFIGTLTFFSGIAAVVGGGVYGLVCRYVPLRTLLALGIALNGAAALIFMNYHPSRTEAIWIEIASSLLGGFGVLPLFDLAVRATPKGGEGMGYALMMSARNFALFGADWLGSQLNTHYHLPWDGLVWLNAGTTFICIFAVPFLPRALMGSRDGDIR